MKAYRIGNCPDEHYTIVGESADGVYYLLDGKDYDDQTIHAVKKSALRLIPDERWEDVTGECQVQNDGRLLIHNRVGNSTGFMSVIPSPSQCGEYYRLRKVRECTEEWANVGVAFIVERKVRG